ncbi:hypothetical protein HOK51_03445 [Candidatus Woesearchaeota archaeon]|jgi:hypothetical protein|nr:hypothetical protein [Candidatus Woesearchaeota archaeon]MBT6518875.1 hypothetical protein [Candidatus Woesearchaeota archaeon]MBT7368014.1 hypothetical protein [Candidatus Woesearchaeota archaeon]
MLEGKDFAALFVGLALFALGLLPILYKYAGVGPEWFSMSLPANILSYIIALGALFLVYASFIEITNSNSMGFISIIVAIVVLSIGLLPILSSFGIGPAFFSLSFLGGLGELLFHIVFLVEGAFLAMSGFLMEM